MRLLDTPTYRTTCIRFGKCEYNVSEKHNQRLMDVPDAREDLRASNSQWIQMTIDECLRKDIAIQEMTSTSKLTAKGHKDMIFEAVAIIREDTTIEQMLSFGKKMEELSGIRMIQAYLHKDEGHYDVIDGSWKPNYHAHLIFSMVSRQRKADSKGRSPYGSIIKLPLHMLYTAQDFIAECTHMERGTSSGRKHLDVIRLKTIQSIASNKRLETEIEKKTAILKSLQAKMDTISSKSEETSGILHDAIYNILEMPLVQKDPMTRLIRSELEAAKNDITMSLNLLERTLSICERALRNEESRLQDRIESDTNDVFSRIGGTLGLSPSVKELSVRNHDLEKRLESYDTVLGAMEKEITSLRTRLGNESDHCNHLRQDIRCLSDNLINLKEKVGSVDENTARKLQENGVIEILEEAVKIGGNRDKDEKVHLNTSVKLHM